MKCDELNLVENPIEWGLYYKKDDVDAAIAELKGDKEQAEDDAAYWRKQYDEETKLTEALKDDIAELKSMVTTDNSAVIANLEAELRKTKRAMWLARAKHCKWAALYFWYAYTDKPKSIRYEKAEAKCFKKAEEYK